MDNEFDSAKVSNSSFEDSPSSVSATQESAQNIPWLYNRLTTDDGYEGSDESDERKPYEKEIRRKPIKTSFTVNATSHAIKKTKRRKKMGKDLIRKSYLEIQAENYEACIEQFKNLRINE